MNSLFNIGTYGVFPHNGKDTYMNYIRLQQRLLYLKSVFGIYSKFALDNTQ